MFVARIAPAASVASRLRKSSSFTRSFSVTASIASSHAARSPRSRVSGSGRGSRAPRPPRRALLRLAGQVLLDRAPREVELLRRHVVEQHGVPGRREDVRDAIAHLPGAEDANGLAHRETPSRNRGGHQIRSSTAATASPPPMQSVTSPRCAFCRCSSRTSVVTRRPPLAPMGWPSATAPPFTFTRSSGRSSSPWR